MQKTLDSKQANKISLAQQQEDKAKFENDQRLQELYNIRVSEAFKTEVYPVSIPKFSDHMRNCLSHFSDMLLKISYEAYRDIAEVKDGNYTYYQLNKALSIIGNAPAVHLGMNMDEYISFKDSLQILMGDFSEKIEAIRMRIKEEVYVTLVAEA